MGTGATVGDGRNPGLKSMTPSEIEEVLGESGIPVLTWEEAQKVATDAQSPDEFFSARIYFNGGFRPFLQTYIIGRGELDLPESESKRFSNQEVVYHVPNTHWEGNRQVDARKLSSIRYFEGAADAQE